jgi:LysR family glycine cleavage system transcriptional activator
LLMPKHPFKMPPLEWIRAFDAAARCGSFTAAATETGLTQSAISQRIGHLEKLLGVALFYRRARSTSLTIEGEAWLPHVRLALNTLKDSSEALGAHDAALDDVVRIRYGTGNWPHDHKLQLFDERIAPLASPELTKNSGHWTEWPRIAYSGSRPGWNTWASRFGISTTPVPHLRFDTFTTALGAARAGLGVILGSLPLCAADIKAGRLVQLSEKPIDHYESYWVIAGPSAVGRTQWDSIVNIVN